MDIQPNVVLPAMSNYQSPSQYTVGNNLCYNCIALYLHT